MKKFTLLALCAVLFTAVRLVAQPTMAPTAPTHAQGDVVSILSNTYTPLAANFTPGVAPAPVALNFFPDWGQGTTFAEFPVAGNPIKRYNALDYQGINFGGNINASGMTTLHWDIWTDVATTLRISLISNGTGERFVEKTTIVGWNSIDIPLTAYTSQSGFSVSSIFQFKFEEFPMAYRAGTKTVYLYNLYFWKPANIPTLTGFTVPAKLVGDAPFALTAPTSPSAGAFTYESSNMSVATISGSTVTVVGAGTSIITANQAAAGAYAAGTTSASLVVTSPGPQVAAATPTKLAANVKSLFSNAYTNLPTDTWRTDWSNGGTLTNLQIAGNDTKKYEDLNFAGITFEGTSKIDATLMTGIHLDVWTSDAATAGFKVKFRDFGPNGVYDAAGDDTESGEIALTTPGAANSWSSYDLPLSDFMGAGKLASRANLAQMVIVSAGKTVWIDNVYFYNEPAAGPTAPTAAAPAPTRPAANVASLYSNTYTPIATTNWNPYNGGNGGVGVVDYSEVSLAGNMVQRYSNLGYSVSEHTPLVNATNATFIHLDVWTAGARNILVKLVDFGANGVYQGAPNDDTEGEVTRALTANTDATVWTGLDIPLSEFVTLGLVNRSKLAQFILSSPSGAPVYVDNIYFYSNTAIPVELVSFKAKANNSTTVLSWLTASEINNQGFAIERSNDGTNYTAIGNVKGNGTTSAAHNYTFTDNAPATGSNYYRLRQTDFNGKETMSSVVSVLFGKSGLIVRNTLAHNSLDVTANDATPTPLSIFSLSGQQVYVGKVQGSQSIDVSALAAGMYIVRTAAGEVGRFVKQ